MFEREIVDDWNDRWNVVKGWKHVKILETFSLAHKEKH